MDQYQKQIRQELLAEYQEIGHFYRHNRTITWTLGAIFIPASLIGFKYAMDCPKYKNLIAILSISLYLFWYINALLITSDSKIYRKRAEKIEEVLAPKIYHRVKIERCWKKTDFVG